MIRRLLIIAILIIARQAMANPVSGESAFVFEARSGETVAAYRGQITVPEHRANKNSRLLKLKYVRFPRTGDQAGFPIIYLAGGPGGSGINAARHERFPLFMAMREFGDVIAFDQRGTGASNDLPECTSSQKLSASTVTSDAAYVLLHQAALRECLTMLRTKGIEPAGYNTLESVADLEVLRAHLAAEKVTLWGISYGSHLSLAALKQNDEHIHRVIIAAVEGLGQTVKQPERTDDYFDRLQAAIDGVPAAKARFPNVKALIRRVFDQLEKTPLLLEVPTREGTEVAYLLQKRTLQQFTAALIADPARAAIILHVIAALDQGDTSPLVALLQQAVDPTDETVAFPTMHILMDVASGTSASRRSMLLEQAEEALLGLHTNTSAMLEHVDSALDLGDAFREPPVSKVPVLLLVGTLDGRTYPASGQEATRGLVNRETVTIRNGGHNVFMMSPEVRHAMTDFMRGEAVDGRRITVPLPDFVNVPGF